MPAYSGYTALYLSNRFSFYGSVKNYKAARLFSITFIFSSASVFFFLSISITSGFAFCTKSFIAQFLFNR